MSATIHEIGGVLAPKYFSNSKIIFLLCMGIHSYLSTKCSVVVTGSCNAMSFIYQIENILGKSSP